MTHCRRKFLHAQWAELLDDNFLEAYQHGVVIECCDGVKRRFYLRIFAYMADYPEKLVHAIYVPHLFLIYLYVEFFLVVYGIWAVVPVLDALFRKIVHIKLEQSATSSSEYFMQG